MLIVDLLLKTPIAKKFKISSIVKVFTMLFLESKYVITLQQYVNFELFVCFIIYFLINDILRQTL